jgi:hypothetical protein
VELERDKISKIPPVDINHLGSYIIELNFVEFEQAVRAVTRTGGLHVLIKGTLSRPFDSVWPQ